MNLELLSPAHRIAMIMERIYADGMTTTSGGNLSIREENGDIWITPRAVDKGTLKPEDVVQVKPDGKAIGKHSPSVELPFHQLTYQGRPDLRAIVHAHPPALIAFSLVRRLPDTSLIPDAPSICGEVGMAEYGLPGSDDLGEKIARVFARGCNTVMLENHGAVAGAGSLSKAFMAFETLDFCARLEIDALRIGTPKGLPAERIKLWRSARGSEMSELGPRSDTGGEREARREICDLVHRACDQMLFTSIQGTFSRRLDEKSFLITPEGVDRRYLEAGDLVRIENGRREMGKTPSRSVPLHQHVYLRHPHVNSIIIARPPSIMAFAVTGEHFESRLIPESYIVLRHVARLPFGAVSIEPEKAAATFTQETPVAMVENDCVIATGSSSINAFDRLEVAEYSARAVVACRNIGAVVMIDDAQAAEIDRAFKPQ
jgi:L-fuculose-phosphate aldolase